MKRMDERFIEGLFDAQMEGKLDAVTDRHVQRILLQLRWQRAISPYLQIFKLTWEVIRGKYWRAFKKVHSGSDKAPGSSPGASVTPVAQFPSGTFTHFPGTGPGATSGLTVAGVNPTPQPAPFALQLFEDAGIKAGEVTGYRCWMLNHETGLLHSSVYVDYVWHPDKIAEGDPSKPHEGVYAYKSILDLHNYGTSDRHHVSGRVDMWGEVYEHERGYRAQYASISWIDDSPHYDASALRKLYGIGVRKRKKK